MVNMLERMTLFRATDRDYRQYPTELNIYRYPGFAVQTFPQDDSWLGLLRAGPNLCPIFSPVSGIAAAADQYLSMPHPVEGFVVPLPEDIEVTSATDPNGVHPVMWPEENHWRRLSELRSQSGS